MTNAATPHVLMGDGCRINYWLDDDAGPDAPVLMLAHSLGASMAMWDAQAAFFATSLRILRYDCRGHGASEVPAGAYGMDRLGRDAIELLDALGFHRVAFCGLSLGGMVGQWLGLRAPDRLSTLVLANTAPIMRPASIWDARIETVRAHGMGAIKDAVLARWFTPEFAQNNTVSRIFDATDPIGYAGCCAAIRDMDFTAMSHLITTPTLVIGGQKDAATPPETAMALHLAITSSHLVMLDAAHLSNIEAVSAFNAALASILREREVYV